MGFTHRTINFNSVTFRGVPWLVYFLRHRTLSQILTGCLAHSTRKQSVLHTYTGLSTRLMDTRNLLNCPFICRRPYCNTAPKHDNPRRTTFYFIAIFTQHSASNSPPFRRRVKALCKLETRVTVMQYSEIMKCAGRTPALESFPSLMHSLPEGKPA